MIGSSSGTYRKKHNNIIHVKSGFALQIRFLFAEMPNMYKITQKNVWNAKKYIDKRTVIAYLCIKTS